MNERDLFIRVLEIPDSAARRAFLAEACGQDPALHQRLTELVAAHESHPSEWLRPPAESGGETTDLGLSADPPRTDPAAAIRPYLTPSKSRDALGRLGPYEVLRVLGAGGFGIVVAAFDETLHRQVAIKIMHPEMARTSPPRKRFLREARAAAAVKHESIVQIYSVHEEPLPHLVMEFIDGLTLQSYMDATGPIDPQEVRAFGRQIALGLAAAHEKGLIHRDIKPANLLLEHGREPRLKLTDFGLARTVDAASITQSGVIAGTPLYMSPEQAAGEPLDARSDLFSLGSVLYAMCVGHPPFRAPSTLAVLKRVVESDPRPIREIVPEVPEGLVAVIARLLAKDPAERFASATAVADALDKCFEQAAPVAPPRPRRGVRWLRVAVPLAILLAAAFYFWPRPHLATSTPASEPWEAKVASMPVGRQIKAVREKLVELNPDFQPEQMECEVAEGRVASVRFNKARNLFDLKPLMVFDGLRSLDLRETGVIDLKGVESLPVTELFLTLRPKEHFLQLQAMTRLVAINGRPVAEVLGDPDTLAPLPGDLWLREVMKLPEVDRWPRIIARMRLLNPKWNAERTQDTLTLDGNKVGTIVHGYGLLDAAELFDISPVKALPNIRFVTLLGPRGFDLEVYRGFKLSEVFGDYSTQPPPNLDALAGMPIRSISLIRYKGSWEPLRAFPLEELKADSSSLEDLTVLAGSSIRKLQLSNCPVSDLAPLAGKPLEELYIQNTRVRDLTPLAKCTRLRKLDIYNLPIDDLTPIRNLPVEDLSINYDPARHRKILSAMPKLKMIGGRPAAEVLRAEE